MQSSTVLLWVIFNLFVLGMLALDLGVFHRRAHAVSKKEAAVWSAVWIGLAMVFNLGIWHWQGGDRALEFLTGYLIEKSLSLDNIFVFIVIFSYFRVAPRHQHRVLYWGILGALVMRGLMIAVGAALLSAFHWVIYIFGGFLVVTGIRFAVQEEISVEPEKNPLLGLLRRVMPVTQGFHEQHFFVRLGERWFATPLFVVLVLIESSDLVFAVDSIPAIFAITRDTFIVYTSNVFAILGLRALYFLLAGVMPMFRYLNVGLGVILSFVGVKMLITEVYKIPVLVSLGVIAAVLAVTIGASLWVSRREAEAEAEPEAGTEN
jgi:tellurite resistance protein TerC